MAALILAADTFTYQLSGQNPALPQVGESISTQIARSIGYLTIIIVGFRSFRSVLIILARSAPIIALILLAFASSAWSPNADATIRKATAYALTLFTGVCLAARYPGLEAIRVVLRTFIVMLFLSVVLVIATPRYGVHQITDTIQNTHAGEWRGVFVHRTLLGRMAGLCAALLVSYGRYFVRTPTLRYASIAVSLLCLVMAGSGGGYLTFAIALLANFIIQRLPKGLSSGQYALLATSAGLVVLGGIAFHNQIVDLTLSALGKTDTLTGRTPLWDFLIPLWLKRPYFGYGFSTGFTLTIVPFLVAELHLQDVPNAQNGYIHTLLSIGLVGLTTALWMVWVATHRSISFARTKSSLRLIPLLICIYFMEVNVVEAWLIEEHNPSLILFATTFAVLVGMQVKKPLEHRSRARSNAAKATPSVALRRLQN